MPSELQLCELRRWCQSVPEVAGLWLFGSRAKRVHRPDSDVDLAIWASLGSWTDLGEAWKREIEQILPELQISLNRFEPNSTTKVSIAVADHGCPIYCRKSDQ